MKRIAFFAVPLLLSALVLAPPAWSKTKTKVRVGDRYTGTVVMTTEPQAVIIPGSRVYYVDDFDSDVYRMGSTWYIMDHGKWYRASTYEGPFVRVRTNTVPVAVRSVPASYRRTWTITTY